LLIVECYIIILKIKMILFPLKGVTREGAEAPPLIKPKLRKKIKISDSFDIFVSQ